MKPGWTTICLRVAALSPSWTAIVGRRVAHLHQATCAITLSLKVIMQKLKVLHAELLALSSRQQKTLKQSLGNPLFFKVAE